MPAYYKSDVHGFVESTSQSVVGRLSAELIAAGFAGTPEQHDAWIEQVEILQQACRSVVSDFPQAERWGVLLEYPMLRLKKRLDTVKLSGDIVAVIEFKIGATQYNAGDLRQVEDYALDLRDFHAASRHLTIVPILCATEAPAVEYSEGEFGTVWPVSRSSVETLPNLLRSLAGKGGAQLDLDKWDSAPYKPVPTIIEAAEFLYAGNQVSEIAHATADKKNIATTTERLIELVRYARSNRKLAVCFVTGIPGSGKTLTGLNLVHDARLKTDQSIKSAFLSGNSPLVEVLREALARDDSQRTGKTLKESRRIVRTEIQHLMDYIKEYVTANPSHTPHENLIVFDEAQRAWDSEYGFRKFKRAKSEPALFLELMARHKDWAVIVALVGGGQEINFGEGGLGLWGSALNEFLEANPERSWEIHAAPDISLGGFATVGRSLFPSGSSYSGSLNTDQSLHLDVSVHNIRCESVTAWVNHLLEGHTVEALKAAREAEDFPVFLTRSLDEVRHWLKKEARGSRHVGLVASSGARRLRADGLGVSLNANDRDAYVHWYLEQTGDIRSSNALEVTANEYTSQGLELDYVGVCWGGDLLWSAERKKWTYRALGGSTWKEVKKLTNRDFVRNKYRVLLTRSRLGMIIWVPRGEASDPTRDPSALDETYAHLLASGARELSLADPKSALAAISTVVGTATATVR